MKQRVEVDGSHIKYPAVKNAFQKANITPSSQPNLHADIVWWDGEIKNRDFENLSPSQRINKIPGMDYICFKSTTIHAFNQMRRMFPNYYHNTISFQRHFFFLINLPIYKELIIIFKAKLINQLHG